MDASGMILGLYTLLGDNQAIYLQRRARLPWNRSAGPMARRLTTNQEIAGSIPASINNTPSQHEMISFCSSSSELGTYLCLTRQRNALRPLLLVAAHVCQTSYLRALSSEELPMLRHRDSWTRTGEYSSREHLSHRMPPVRLPDTCSCIGLVPQEPILPSEMELVSVV